MLIRGLLTALLVVLAAILFWALSNREPVAPEVMEGRAGTSPARIVSLAPSLTEILVYFGAAERIVGVTVRCEGIDPGVARVGDLRKTDFERIVSLAPDTVIVIESVAQENLVRSLRAFGISTEVIPGETVEDLMEGVRRLGALVEAEARVDEILVRIERELSTKPRPDAPSVLFVVNHGPFWVAGGGSFVNRMISAAGGRNVFEDDPAPFLRVDLEQMLVRDPDLIVDTTLPADSIGPSEVWERFSRLRAVREGRIHSFPPVYAGIQIPEWIVRLRGIVTHRRN